MQGQRCCSNPVLADGSHIIQVQPFPGPGPRSTVLTGSMCPPASECLYREWSRDGRQLFLQIGRKEMIVEVDTSGGHFRTRPPEMLFETDFDVHAVSFDGNRFLATRSRGEPRWDHINVLSGWWNEKDR